MKAIIRTKRAAQLLIYGLYAVLCHAAAILFSVCLAESSLPPNVLAHAYAPMLEYTAMTLTIILVGTMLVDIAERERDC